MRAILPAFVASCVLLITASVSAAPVRYNVSGRLVDGSGYSVLLVQKNGASRSALVTPSGAFQIRRVTLAQLRGATLQLIDPNGQYAGPIVLARNAQRASTTFSGKAETATAFVLGRVALQDGYATLRRNQLPKVAYTRPSIPTVSGRPIGAGELGLVAASGSSAGGASIATESNPGEDVDRDGIPSAFDADDDGDLILDASDPDTAGQDIPYTNLGFDFRKTLNAHVRDGLNDTVIDAAVGGENAFSLTFFFSLPQNLSSVDGGHVVCDDALTYCRRNNPVAFYGGVSESNADFRGRPWSELLTSDGYPRMERISVGSNPAIVASIQPRVGRAQFRPGDVYQVNLTEATRVVSSRSLALAPYFVSIPALKEYNAGSGTVTVDYGAVTPTIGSIPGMTGNPIVVSNDGLLTLTFWRPQRGALRSDESGFYDWGNLNYGVVVDQAQATCAGLYSGLSGDLTEASNALGTGGSPLAQNGAKLSPLVDGQADRATDVANVLSFTVNLKQCIARVGLSPGTYTVTLRAAGSPVTGGEITSTQLLTVQIP